MNKNLRPAAAYEPVQKHKVTPSILGWLNKLLSHLPKVHELNTLKNCRVNFNNASTHYIYTNLEKGISHSNMIHSNRTHQISQQQQRWHRGHKVNSHTHPISHWTQGSGFDLKHVTQITGKLLDAKCKYRKVSNIRRNQIPKLKLLSYRLAVVFAQSIEVMCSGENEDVVGAAPTGDAPTTSELSTISGATYIRGFTVE